MAITLNDLAVVTSKLAEGFGVTLQIFALTLLFALPLGLIISFGSMSKIWIIKYPIKFFIWIIRGTPLMLQLLVVYYGPSILFGVKGLSNFPAVIITFVINYACYFSEIYRGGIESIPKGQYEAGQVLGLKKSQTFFRIVLLQVVKHIVPPMSNEIITLVKDTSLARTIMLYEVIWAGQKFVSKGLLWPLFYTAIFYLVFCGVLTVLFGQIEKKLNYFS
ncbi:MAG: amino acid ABC transporter permease [Clostridia bacterium]|nr:amino acid ABC transporter permease [Clostridia bacterium]